MPHRATTHLVLALAAAACTATPAVAARTLGAALPGVHTPPPASALIAPARDIPAHGGDAQPGPTPHGATPGGGASKADPAASANAAPDKPDTPAQRRRALEDLYAHLAATENAKTAAPLVAAIERLWLFSGSDTIDVLMERVLKAVSEKKFSLAEKLADTIVELEPGFAEGWNRRALVAYLRGDHDNALNALRRALALEPSHFKALDGIAQIMREQGDKAAALKTYRQLLNVHPFWEGGAEAVEQLKREIEGQGI